MSLQEVQKAAIQGFIQSITFDGYNLTVNIDDTNEISEFPFLKITSFGRVRIGGNTHQSRHKYSYKLTCDYQLDGENPISETVIDELQTAIVNKLESSATALQNYNVGAGSTWIDMIVPRDERDDLATNKRRVTFLIETMVLSRIR
jgi:hypothetical protein